MVSCLIIHETQTPQGGVLYRDQVLNKALVTIGRSESCDIHLPDHSVRLRHASICQSSDGLSYLRSVERIGNEPVDENNLHDIELTTGVKFKLGAYEFEVLAPQAEHHLVLSVAHIETSEPPQTSLHKDWLQRLGKRKVSYFLMGGIATLFFFMPLLPSLSPALDRAQQEWVLSLNQSWSAGQISRGHSIYEKKCSMCHQKAMSPVKSQVCRDCHKDISSHIASAKVEQQGIIKVECTQCHLEHRAEKGLVLHDSSLCTNCHVNLVKSGFNSALANTSHFENDHPAFSVSIQADEKLSHGNRVLLSDKVHLEDQTKLKFSHQIHLSESGVSSPEGDTILTCKDCHRLDSSGEHFTPLSMEKNCQQSRCHSITYDEPLEGRAPHGSSTEIVYRVKLFFLEPNQINSRDRNCPPQSGNAAQKMNACANIATNEYLSRTLFKNGKGCGECHEVKQTDMASGKWSITPVKVEHDWFSYSKFPHLKHNAINCDACHDKRKSKRSSDLSMPDIKVCRTCHSGDIPRANKIANRCDSCHKFHTKSHQTN